MNPRLDHAREDVIREAADWLASTFPRSMSITPNGVQLSSLSPSLTERFGNLDHVELTAAFYVSGHDLSTAHPRRNPYTSIPWMAFNYHTARRDRMPFTVGRGGDNSQFWCPPLEVTSDDLVEAQQRFHIADFGISADHPRLPTDGRMVGIVQELVDQLVKDFPITTRSDAEHHIGSYGLKHTLERERGRYASNGETILAATVAGYMVTRTRAPNAVISIDRGVYEMLRARSYRTG
ncbi:MAG: hypothetical protein E6R04_06820 [Spirochaetes bacterium]|nr:MAG: hypothetical protein E6R04_06820 [Spirochaetota bacterium]